MHCRARPAGCRGQMVNDSPSDSRGLKEVRHRLSEKGKTERLWAPDVDTAVQHFSEDRVVVHTSCRASVMNLVTPLQGTPRSPIGALKAHPIAVGVIAALALSALVNRYLAKKAERANPPIGRLITVNGVRLHYFERGTGTPLVLLHGNGTMIEDFQSSGLIDLAAKKHRVKSLAEEENADQLLNQVARPLMSAAKMPAPVQ